MFAGCFSLNRPLADWGSAERILFALAPFHSTAPSHIWKSEKNLLVQVATKTGEQSAHIQLHDESGIAVAFWGRLDNRPELISLLNATPAESDDALVALAWLKWGVLCAEKLDGDFSFSIVCTKTQSLFLARDRMGVKPLFYRLDGNGLFFANSVAPFKVLEIGTLTPSKAWMARFLLYLSNSHTETAYEEVFKLPPAHWLLMKSDGKISLNRYHKFTLESPRTNIRDPHWLEAYRAIWEESIALRLPASGIIACENSGGLDSGSITSEVARQLGADIDRLRCYGFSREPLEPEAIMSVAMKYGIKNTFISSRPSDYHYLPEVIDRSIAVNGYPIEMGVAEDHNDFYRMAAGQGAGTLFSGFGGDELLTSMNYEAREEFIDHQEFGNLNRTMTGHPLRRPDRSLRYLYRDRFKSNYNDTSRQDFEERWMWTFFTTDAEQTFNLRNDFIGGNDYAMPFRDVNALGLTEVNRPHVSVRMENCTLMAASHGLDYVWPLLDTRLIQQWLSTPTLWKIGDGGILRNLHRCAITGVCPDSITWKRTKGMGSGGNRELFDVQSNRHHFQQLLDCADAMPNSLTDIVDVIKLRTLANKGLQQDTRGYGVFSAMIMLNWTLQALVSWVGRRQE